MRAIKTVLFLFIVLEPLKSCLVLPCASNHYFTSIDSSEKDIPKVFIFSTPQYKKYIVQDIDMNAAVFIQSPIFENPGDFHLLQNEDFFRNKVKQYTLNKGDRKFYKKDLYKFITLKIISREKEEIITYKIIAK